MTKKFHAALSYPGFDELTNKIDTWINSRNISRLDYSSKLISARLTQRIVEVGLASYVRNSAEFFSVDKKLGSIHEKLYLDGLVVNTQTGCVRPRVFLFLKSIIEFHISWIHALIRASLSLELFKARKSASAATLVFGIGIESIFAQGDDRRFINYCRFGPIEPLHSSSRLVVQALTKNTSTEASYVTYCRFPLFELLTQNSFKNTEYKRFLGSHMQAMLSYWASVIRAPISCLIGKDFANHSVAKLLNDNALINAIILTNSNYSAQPLWMRHLPNKQFKTHMVWYAQNTIPIVYKDNPIKASIPNYRHLSVDVSWVWTKGYAEYLSSLGHQSQFKIVGPIVWHIPDSDSSLSITKDEVIISVFDVSPVNDSFADELGLYGNYYSPENMVQFIRSVVDVLNKIGKGTGINIRIMLKHKREHHARHSKEYINQISRLKESGEIQITPYDENIFSLIGSSALVIVVPYSSPAYVADSLCVPAVFFDPTGEVFPLYEQSENIHFASSKDHLQEIICNILSNRKLLENEHR